MSDNIPFEIQVKILKSLPVKSLIQFRSVSKEWKSLIDSSKFISDYNDLHSQPQHLLVRYNDPVEKYVSVDDNDTFPLQNISLFIPVSVNLLKNYRIVGYSHGLLCLYGHYHEGSDYCPGSGSDMAVMWNPSIRKSVAIRVPRMLLGTYNSILGFGVCPLTNDPKIIKITYPMWQDNKSLSCILHHVEVFSLNSGVWRNPYSNLPRTSIGFAWKHVVIDGYIYWLAGDSVTMNVGFGFSFNNLIISFDLSSEEFGEVYLSDTLAQRPPASLSISKIRESVVVLDYSRKSGGRICDVWKMEHGVPKSFTKLYTIDLYSINQYSIQAPDAAPNAVAFFQRVLGFRKGGEPIIEMVYDYGDDYEDEDDYENHIIPNSLAVYEPDSEQMSEIGIYGIQGTFYVNSYMESLLLLHQ